MAMRQVSVAAVTELLMARRGRVTRGHQVL